MPLQNHTEDDNLQLRRENTQQQENLEALFQETQDQQNTYLNRNLQRYQEQPERSAFQKKGGIGNIYQAIQEVMPEAYDNQKNLVRAGEAQVKLHHGRGTKLVEQGENVLEFDIAGSGFAQFQRYYKGLQGKSNFMNSSKEKVSLKQIKKGEIKISWYNKYFSWLPKIQKVEQIKRKNKVIQEYQERSAQGDLAEKTYGTRTTQKGLEKKEHILVKSQKQILKDGMETEKRRVTMAGPLFMGGLLNRGDYKIENLRKYMLQMGQGYLEPLFDQWSEICAVSRDLVREGKFAEAETIMKRIHPVTILLKGHSRGAVAMGHGAMMIRHWVDENYPQFRKYVKFETVNYDPVPGIGNVFGLKRDMNITDARFTTADRREEMEKQKMKPLGRDAETTVVYSLHTQYANFFTPQMIHGAKRVILTPFSHAVGLDQTDKTQEKAHRAAFTDAKSGEVYRNSGLSELDSGFYIVDENYSLVKIPDYETAKKILDKVLKRAGSGQYRRHNRMYLIASAWFRQYGNANTNQK